MGKEKRCKNYVGLSCIDGSCPIANSEEYEERCIPTIKDCQNCWMYKGCEDCASFGTEYCDEKMRNENEWNN